MSISVKIRILLALLCASLVLTAVVVRQLYTPQENLKQSARMLEDNLQKKEKQANELLSPARFNQLKTIGQHDQEALNLIDDYTSNKRIWICTILNGKLNFWSGVKVIPDRPEYIKDGTSFIKQPNGYYAVVKKTEGNFSALFFIPVRSNYYFSNQYLTNTIDRDLLSDNNLDIADFTDKSIRSVQSLNHTYLFSVKLRNNIKNHVFLGYEVALWMAALFTLCLIVHSLIVQYARKRGLFKAIGSLALFIMVLRFTNLYFHYPAVIYELDLFNPAYYHANIFFPSLGDLCLNTLLFTWLSAFIYHYRHKLIRRSLEGVAAYVVLIAGTGILAFLLTKLINLFAGLVINTSINFDVENILNMSGYSIVAVIMLCFCFIAVFLLTETFLVITTHMRLSIRHKLYVFAGCILLLTVASSLYHHVFALLFLLWGALMLIRGYAIVYNSERYNPFAFVALVVICALITSIKFSDFQSIKEKETRKVLIHRLENTDDATAKQMFKVVERRIVNDRVLSDYFTRHQYNSNYLKSLIQKNYFDGYLSDYDFRINEFDAKGQPLSSGNKYALNDFKDMVLYSSLKVSDYFYRENDAFGYKKYFAIIPVYAHDQLLGTLSIELKSKPLQFSYSFPQILVNNQLANGNEFKDYSYAFYRSGHLLSQSGNYVYNLVNNTFTGKLKDYTFKTTRESSQLKPWFERLTTYNHLVYQPSKQKLIVVTREDNSIAQAITSLTFFFVLLLLFSLLVVAVIWLWTRVKIVSVKDNHLIWGFKVKFSRILYKTRIQLSMIFAVVVTLIMVGVVTYLSIRSQYISQQDEMMIDKVTRVASAFENSEADEIQHADEESQLHFNEFADNFSTDLVLFNRDGIPQLSTQPKIYTYGLLAKRINGRAYILLHNLQMSVVVNEEKIGSLSYKAAYAPIRNAKNATIGYLQVPYFSNEVDYKERIGSLLNAMINIYALIFMAIGLLAVIIARQITAPLSFIQQSLSRTIYGQKNEPIAWERDDEIGALVKEYNNMIAALEHSANRLAQSERESAWREMAKQVAHEIKNPLTPLKLGLQLLEKSWKDKDPKFDAKFERFSKSFVEQIESLSSIASEFSAFAKMPDTRMERLNVLETLGQAVTIFKHMENVHINYQQPDGFKFMVIADRDQLLRCFNNLLKNAIEAMPHGRIGIIDIDYTISNNQILFTIKDNGNGIPENLRERIFEPNFTTKSSGTGLGLAFVKNSIENARGKVWFETETGNGTTFYINLPKSRI